MTRPFLAYRDRIGARSEIGFLRRQYVGFTRLHPVWTGRAMLPGAERVGEHRLRLKGPLRRLLFRHLGVAPRIPFPDLFPVLHAQFARGGALALPIAQALDLKLFVTLHGGDVAKEKNWHGTVLARRWLDLVRQTQSFICVSATVAEVAAARGVPLDKLTILPIGVEVPAEPPERWPESFLFVGRFVEKKGIAILAEAMRLLRAAGDATPLICIGDGPMRPVLEELARTLPGITLTGWLAPEEVQVRMRQAIALIVPSIIADDGDAEGLPSVIPEAMASAVPVIGSDQGGIGEAVEDQRTGILVAPGDAHGLAEAMRHLAEETGLSWLLGQQAFAHTAAHLNARHQSAALEQLFLDAAGGAPR